MRYFINPETGLTFALAETEMEKMMIKPPKELVELDMDMFRVIFEGYDKPKDDTKFC